MNLELTDTVVKIMTLDVRKDFISTFHQSILNVISSFGDSFKSTATRWKQISDMKQVPTTVIYGSL